jgi:hypothetical protein
MSTDLWIVMEHNLNSHQIADLPNLLNQYFAPYLQEIQIRGHRSVHNPDTELLDWSWSLEELAVWEAQQDKLFNEDPWRWAWYPEEGTSFEEWFQDQQELGHFSLVGCYGMTLWVGARSIVLDPAMRLRFWVVDITFQTDLRNFLSYLADFFGTKSVLYFPDDLPPTNEILDYVSQGWSFSQIVDCVGSQQPPVTSIQNMLETSIYASGRACLKLEGYYMEDVRS